MKYPNVTLNINIVAVDYHSESLLVTVYDLLGINIRMMRDSMPSQVISTLDLVQPNCIEIKDKL